MSRLAIIASTTRVGTNTNFPFTIISSPPRSKRCDRAACSCSSRLITRWTNWIRPCARCFRQKAELLGAIRLPNTAFKKNAGTEVTTDIVMLRRLRAGESPGGAAWKAAADFTNEQKENLLLNEYFVAHPEMMLGAMRLGRGLYSNDEPTLEPDERDLGEALAQAVERIAAKHLRSPKTARRRDKPLMSTFPRRIISSPTPFVSMWMAAFVSSEDDKLRPLDDVPVETRSRIRRLIEVRDAVRLCLRSQLDGSAEEQVVEAREELNFAYDRFVSRFGPINARVNQNAFDGDPDLPLLLSLEHYDEENSRAKSWRFSASAPFITTNPLNRSIHPRKPCSSR